MWEESDGEPETCSGSRNQKPGTRNLEPESRTGHATPRPGVGLGFSRKVYVRLRGKGNANSHAARPVHLIITIIKWIRISRLSIKNSLSSGLRTGLGFWVERLEVRGEGLEFRG